MSILQDNPPLVSIQGEERERGERNREEHRGTEEHMKHAQNLFFSSSSRPRFKRKEKEEQIKEYVASTPV